MTRAVSSLQPDALDAIDKIDKAVKGARRRTDLEHWISAEGATGAVLLQESTGSPVGYYLVHGTVGSGRWLHCNETGSAMCCIVRCMLQETWKAPRVWCGESISRRRIVKRSNRCIEPGLPPGTFCRGSQTARSVSGIGMFFATRINFKATSVKGDTHMFNIGLYRSRKHKIIFGVCGGIADQLGVKPVWVRLGTVVLAVVIPGVSIWPVIALYIALGLALPTRDNTSF